MDSDSDPFIRRRTAPIKLTPKPKAAIGLPDLPLAGQGQGQRQSSSQNVPVPVRREMGSLEGGASVSASASVPSWIPARYLPKPKGQSQRSSQAVVVPPKRLPSATVSAPSGPSWIPPRYLPEPKEAEHSLHPVRIRKEGGVLNLFEFKETCKFKVEDMWEMVVQRVVKEQGCDSSGKDKDKAPATATEEKAPVTVGPANSEYREKERKEAKLRKWKARRGYFGGKEETVKVEEVGLTVKTVGDSKSYKMNGTQRNIQDVSGAYYVFVESRDGSCYEAFPVKDWLNFEHESKVVPLSAKEAEEAFQKRNKILNHFALMINKKVRGDEEGHDENVEEGMRKRSIRAMNSYDVEYMDSGPNSSDSECEEKSSKKELDDDVQIVQEVAGSSRKNRKRNKPQWKKKAHLNASFDENDQDFESSGADSDSEVDQSQSQGYQCGVDEEEGLRDLLISDESESEEELDKEVSIIKVPKKRGRKRLPRPPEFKVTQCDVADSAPVPLVLKKAGSRGWNVGSSPEPEEQLETSGKLKLVLKRTSAQPSNGPPPKRMRENAVVLKTAKENGLTKDEVKRYLTRKPMNITDLLRKFAGCKKAMTVEEITTAIGQFIRELDPRLSVVNGKTMYFIPSEEDLSSGTYFSQFGQ